jgi:hypothetical protein
MMWLSVALVTLLLIWFGANRMLDEAPDPLRSHFLISSHDRIADDRNVAIGILGLTAPSGADFIQHGISVKTLRATDTPWEQIQNAIKGPRSLQPTLTSHQLTCWLDPDLPLFKECLPFDQAPIALEKNKELLQRFRALYQLDRLLNDGGYYNSAYIDLAKLSVADMQLDLRQRDYSAAYQKWHDQLYFARRNLRGTDDWVGKAIGAVVLGITSPFLEDLLLADPHLAIQHHSGLLTLLRPEAVAFHPEGLAQAEYSQLAVAFERSKRLQFTGLQTLDWLILHLGQKNRILNRYATYLNAYTQALRLPWAQIDPAFARLREQYASNVDTWDFIIDPFGAIFLFIHIEGNLKTREILRQMHVLDGRFRLSTLLVQLVNAQVPDDDIENFLASSDRQLWDEFSGSPMKWDAKNRRIYFSDSNEKCIVNSVRVPQLIGSKQPQPPRSSPSIC